MLALLAFSINSKDISNIVEVHSFFFFFKKQVPGNIIQMCVMNNRVKAYNTMFACSFLVLALGSL